jgi:two-component system, NtrC family, sensor kinase
VARASGNAELCLNGRARRPSYVPRATCVGLFSRATQTPMLDYDMPQNAGRGPTRVEVFGPATAAEEWTEIIAGRSVEVLVAQTIERFPDATSDLAVAIVEPREAARVAAQIDARGSGPAGSVALLISPPGAAHALVEFARALAQAKREWEQAFDAIVDPVAILATDGRVRRANRAFAKRVGRAFDQLIGAHYADLLGAPPAPDPIAEALLNSQSLVRETQFAALTGTFQVTLSPLSEQHQQPGAVMILKDVTELRDQQARLERAHRLSDIGRLAAGIAHEISTPLASIALRAESLLRHAQDGRLVAVDTFADFPRYLRTIEDETFRCKRIIGALLEFSRPRRPEVLTSDLNALAEKAASLVSDQMKAKQVSLKLELAPSLPPVVIDPAQLREALIALLLNALDACERGGAVTVATHTVADKRVCVVVTDNGAGIPPENLDKVVTPFFTTKPIGQGTGLGLSICDGVVRAHGGQMRLESLVGKGTSVSLELPVRPTSPVAAAPGTETPGRL